MAAAVRRRAGLGAVPVFVGAWFGHLDYGVASGRGGLAFLYTPPTPLYHRMITVMACAFALTACYAMGLMSHFVPATAEQVPTLVGLVFLGALLASLIAFFYSLYAVRVREPRPIPPLGGQPFAPIVLDAFVIAAMTGGSLVIAQALQLERAYWVPFSCLSILQGTTLRAVWNKQMHRSVGTAIGLLLAWCLLALPLGPWGMATLRPARSIQARMTGLAPSGSTNQRTPCSGRLHDGTARPWRAAAYGRGRTRRGSRRQACRAHRAHVARCCRCRWWSVRAAGDHRRGSGAAPRKVAECR